VTNSTSTNKAQAHAQATIMQPRAGGTTAYRGASSGWPMEEALYEVTLKGCAE